MKISVRESSRHKMSVCRVYIYSKPKNALVIFTMVQKDEAENVLEM